MSDRTADLAVLSDREAADLWGVSRQYVNALRRRLGVPRPETDAERTRREVLTAWNLGASPPSIAVAVGITEKRVREILRVAGVGPPPTLAPCGTRTAYMRHLRRGEPIDPDCSAANNAAAARQRRKES